MEEILGYAAMKKGAELEPLRYQLPPLKENEVRVSITHCGLCYTDIHAIEDYYEVTTYPFVPGHEIVGYVSEVGSSVTLFKIGERVGIGWQRRSCGSCEFCLKGEVQLCEDIVHAGSWGTNGGFSDSVTTDHRFAYPLPEGLPSEDAAVLLCAGVTVFSPLWKNATRSSLKVGIIGVGGLGHLAIQFAHALGYEVTAISSSLGKEQEARSFGADHFMVTGDKVALRKMKFTFDLLLYTAHSEMDWSRLLITLKNNGKLILNGFAPSDIKFEPIDMVVHQQTITGSFLGNQAMMREMLSFAQVNKIAPRIELMPMAQVKAAIRRLRENKARYRIVLENSV
jgi:uncharacterized zinc-type alcohol dehydrogenase-like protein